MPSGVLASAVTGLTAAAAGWWLIGLLPTISTSYTRLDQLTALVLGAVIGGAIVATREVRQRRSIAPGLVAGALLGGIGSLAAASLMVFATGAVRPQTFLIERAATWGCVAAGCATAIGAMVLRYRGRQLVECAGIAALGGAVAGVIYMLPGAADVWQAIASLWLGATIGVAVGGPELWHAVAVIELLPARNRAWRPLSVREWPLYDGTALTLGEAQLSCASGRVAFHPPAGGAVAEGHAIRSPRFVDNTIIIAVGRSRYLVQLLRMR